MHVSEVFRLVRGTGHILDVLDVLHRDRLALRIHDGACSAVDLTARSPRTGELLSTVKFMVQTLPAAAAGALQRDLQREPAYDGLRADRAEGSKGGHRGGREDRRRTHRVLEGRPIAALARDHGVSRGAIRLGLRRDDLRLVCGGVVGCLVAFFGKRWHPGLLVAERGWPDSPLPEPAGMVPWLRSSPPGTLVDAF